MSYILAILEVLKAIPQLLSLIKTLMESVDKMRNDALIKETKKAVADGDTRKVEANLGAVVPGTPSGIDGAVVRPKTGN